MSTIQDLTELQKTTALARSAYGFLKQCWDTFQEGRTRLRLRSALNDLTDFELRDIGIARDEIDYVVMNRPVDPRGAISN